MKMTMREFDQQFNHIDDLVRCSVGQPGYFTPKEILESMQRSLDQSYHQYPPVLGHPKLLELLCTKHHVESNQIVITHGASEALNAVFADMILQEEEVILLSPNYTAYFSLCQLYHLVTHEVQLEFPNYEITKEKLEEAVNPKCRYLIVNSPNNPTGISYSERSFQCLFDFCKGHQLVLILDRSYCDFETNIINPPKDVDTIEIYSFSKTYNMTEFRIGYSITDKNRSTRLRNIVSLSSVGVATCIQEGAIAALQSDATNAKEYVKKNSEKMIKLLNRYGLKCSDQTGYYCWFDVSALGLSAEEFCVQCASEVKILFMPGSFFGKGNQTKIRACMAIGRFNEMCTRLETFLNQVKR